MKLTTLLSTAAITALASAKKIQLFVRSQSSDIGIGGISSLHEGAGINYLSVTTNTTGNQVLEFDEEQGVIYQEIEGANAQFRYNLGIMTSTIDGAFPFLELGVIDPGTTWSTHNGRLVSSNCTNFYAGKNVNDPYNYSKNGYFLGAGTPEQILKTGQNQVVEGSAQLGEDIEEVDILVVDVDSDETAFSQLFV